MKKVILFLIFGILFVPSFQMNAQASLISDRAYRSEQNKIYKSELNKIKNMLKIHNDYANKHDLKGLGQFYADNYINNDGFNKEVYFKNIEETWEECKDLTYTSKILSAKINGDYASVEVEETATGTLYEERELTKLAGEIHSKSTGIYHLVKISGNWFISGETLLSDESSLLYGDARFMNIELQSPSQVASGESYTVSVKIDADKKTYIIGSLDNDPVTYPAKVPNAPMRLMPDSHVLERVLSANSDNVNEYSVASLAVSKAKDTEFGDYQVYLSGLACLMKRVNVVPVNKLIKIEDDKNE